MKRRIVSLMTVLLVALTIFAVPVVSSATGTEPSDMTDVIQPTEPGDLTESTDPMLPTEPGDSTDPADPMLPTEPDDSTNPTEPEDEKPAVPVEKISIAKGTVTIAKTSYAFTKKAIKPAVTVKVSGKVLKAGTDYKVSYSNNVYPGTAKVTVTGKGNYTGTATKTFRIGTPTGLKQKAATVSSVTLDWANASKASGYTVYRYNSSSKTWKAVKKVSKSELKISKLKAGLGYQFRVRAYYKVGGKTYYSPATATLKTPTKPLKITVSKVINHPSLYAKVSWGVKNSSGYQVRISRNSSFKNATTYKVAGKNTLSRKVTKLVDGKKYYVKVRAYKTYGSKTVYGNWSKAKSFTTDGTRWYTVSGKKYYYEKGKKVYGTKKIAGEKYYFRTDTGVMSGASYTMWSKVRNSTSKTKYLVAVSKAQNRICVYTGKKGNWVLKYHWKCSTGAPENGKISKTPVGSWLMPKAETHLGYIGGHEDYTCWYATRFYKRCFFHSVIYEPASKTKIQDGRLGMNISDGCIRMDIKNAKWIYDNCHAGTRVIVY